jgi:hypothetical protein
MKKNSLTTALLAGLAGAAGLATTAHAVNLNPDGLGQALIYPYYGVNSGNQTIVTVVNTANDVKAVKVRFLESRNSREVIDFNLYLSPFDVWTGSVFSLDANGAANLVTLDNSCTVPAIKGNTGLPSVGGNRYVPFRNVQYTGQFADGGGTNLARTREGHIEIIEMGVLLGDGAVTSSNGRLAEEATHNSSGVPASCARLVAAWSQGGAWTGGGAANNTNSPTGGLFGSGSVVDVANGTMLAYNADAIDGFYFTGNSADDIHNPPGSVLPTLADARTGSRLPPVSSFVFRGGATSTVVQSLWNDRGVNALAGVDAVSAVFLHDAIYNEYTTDATLGAASEWVVTFPTKRFYVDDSAFGGPSVLPDIGTSAHFALAPFAGLGFTVRGSGGTLLASAACEDVSLSIYDREEQTTTQPIDFSPQPTQGVNQLCEETNVITFRQSGAESAILGTPASRYLNIETPFADGWMRMAFTTNSDTGNDPGFLAVRAAASADGDQYRGLPVTGFAAVNVINRAATPGNLANYSGLYKHRGSRNITGS